MKTTVKLLLALMLVTGFTGCKKEKTDKAQATFKIEAKTSANRPGLNRTANTGTFTFSKALIGVNEIDFEFDAQNDDNDVEYEGAYQFDVLNGTSTPAIHITQIEPGTYHDLEINVDQVLPAGNSIDIAGTYTDNGTTYTFEFTSTMDEDYDIEDNGGIQVSDGDLVHFVLYLDLPALFNGVNFANAVPDNNGVIHFNETSNHNIASIIEDNFDNAMDFDED